MTGLIQITRTGLGNTGGLIRPSIPSTIIHFLTSDIHHPSHPIHLQIRKEMLSKHLPTGIQNTSKA